MIVIELSMHNSKIILHVNNDGQNRRHPENHAGTWLTYTGLTLVPLILHNTVVKQSHVTTITVISIFLLFAGCASLLSSLILVAIGVMAALEFKI